MAQCLWYNGCLCRRQGLQKKLSETVITPVSFTYVLFIRRSAHCYFSFNSISFSSNMALKFDKDDLVSLRSETPVMFDKHTKNNFQRYLLHI